MKKIAFLLTITTIFTLTLSACNVNTKPLDQSSATSESVITSQTTETTENSLVDEDYKDKYLADDLKSMEDVKMPEHYRPNGFSDDYNSIPTYLIATVDEEKFNKFIENENVNILSFIEHFNISKADFKAAMGDEPDTKPDEDVPTEQIRFDLDVLYGGDKKAIREYYNQDEKGYYEDDTLKDSFFTIKGYLFEGLGTETYYDFAKKTYETPKFNIANFVKHFNISKADFIKMAEENNAEDFYNIDALYSDNIDEMVSAFKK